MTVETEISRSGPYAGAGTTGPFLVDFRILDATHLRVVKRLVGGIEVTLAYPADYLVTGVGDPTSSLTTILAVLAGETLTIIRDVPKTQEADYVQNDDFPAETHENALDKLTMIVQQLDEEQDRALTLPVSSASGVSTELPVPQSNAIIGWNQEANALQNVDPATLATVVAFGTTKADLFSGTGAQTVFTLSANPGAQANLDVAVSGVTQRPGIDYTWAGGTTLTFTTAPPLGTNNILARYQQGLPQGVADLTATIGLLDDVKVAVQRTTIAAVSTTLHNWLDGTVISAAEVGITPAATSAANTAALNALILASPGRRIYFPSGTYQFGNLVLAGNTHHWFGDGVEGTKFVYTGTGTFINAQKPTDEFIPRSPIYLEGIQFDGVAKGTKVGLSIKNRHDYVIRNCEFRNFSTLIKLEMAYIGLLENVNGTACDIGWDLVGDINRVAFRSCGVTDFATYGIRAKPGSFGCLAVEMSNCDFEFAGGVCVRWECIGAITLRDCYIGDGCFVNTFEITAGRVKIDGGLVLCGQQNTFLNRLVEFVGVNPTTDERSIEFENVHIGGGAFVGPDSEKFIKGDGKVYIPRGNPLALLPAWNGIAAVIFGDPLGFAPGRNDLTSPEGRLFTGGQTGTITFTSVPSLTTGGLTLTCTVPGAAGNVLHASIAIAAGRLPTRGAVSIIVVYRSNSTWGGNLSTTVFNGAPTSPMGVGMLPSTAGNLRTLVMYNQIPLLAAYNFLEFFRADPVAGDFIDIREVYLMDSRQTGSAGVLFTADSLTKPIS